MKKKELQEGMQVKNAISGNTGVIHDPKAYLLPFVGIRRLLSTGKYVYANWRVKNLKEVVRS